MGGEVQGDRQVAGAGCGAGVALSSHERLLTAPVAAPYSNGTTERGKAAPNGTFLG